MRLALPLVAALAALLATLAGQDAGDEPAPVRFLSANVRYGSARDGEHAWPRRKDILIEALRGARPDVLGLQEALDFQVDAVRAAFPRHVVLGEGRDGGDRGEWCALIVDAERFAVRACGTFRLAPKDELGAVGWDAALTRIATWAELADRTNGGRVVRVINAHFDHKGEVARAESAALIARWTASRPVLPTVVMGDLNAGETSVPLATLREAGFRDTFRDVHPTEKRVGTGHGFDGGRTGEKIDHVLVDRSLVTEDAWIDWTEEPGRYPSDHRFVGAAVRPK